MNTFILYLLGVILSALGLIIPLGIVAGIFVGAGCYTCYLAGRVNRHKAPF